MIWLRRAGLVAKERARQRARASAVWDGAGAVYQG